MVPHFVVQVVVEEEVLPEQVVQVHRALLLSDMLDSKHKYIRSL
jgi:hypothetical protein